MKRDERSTVPVIPIIAAVLVVAGVGMFSAWWMFPEPVIPETLAKGATQFTDKLAVERLRLDARKSSLDTVQLCVAIMGAVGLVGTLIYTALNFRIAERTYRVTEVTKIIEGYSKAMDQFASDKADIRIGAIYTLGRIAQHSSDAHWNIMHHLCAYLYRRRSTRPAATGDSPQAGRFETEAILTVLRNRRHDYERHDEALQLSSIRLDRADFRRAVLRGARFQFVDLSYATFQEADLSGKASFFKAILRSTKFDHADLREADFSSSVCTGTGFRHADLRKANFFKTTLQSSNFHRADLRGAEFTNAVCSGAEFTHARLRGAEFEGASGFVTAGNWCTRRWLRRNTNFKVNVRSSEKPPQRPPPPPEGAKDPVATTASEIQPPAGERQSLAVSANPETD